MRSLIALAASLLVAGYAAGHTAWPEVSGSGSGVPGLNGSTGTNETIRFVDAGNVDRFASYGETRTIYWEPGVGGTPAGTAAAPWDTIAEVEADLSCGTLIIVASGTHTSFAGDLNLDVGDCGGQDQLGVALVSRTRVGSTSVWYHASDSRAVFNANTSGATDVLGFGGTTGPALYLGENLSVVTDVGDAFDVKGGNRLVLLNPVCTHTSTDGGDQCYTAHVDDTVLEVWNGDCTSGSVCHESVQDGYHMIFGGLSAMDWTPASGAANYDATIQIRNTMSFDIIGHEATAGAASGTIACLGGRDTEYTNPSIRLSLSYLHDCIPDSGNTGHPIVFLTTSTVAPTLALNLNTFSTAAKRGIKFEANSGGDSASATASGTGNLFADDFIFPVLWWVGGFADNWSGGFGFLTDWQDPVTASIRVTPVAGGNNDYNDWTALDAASGVPGAIADGWGSDPGDINSTSEGDALTSGHCTDSDCVASFSVTHTLHTCTSGKVLGTPICAFTLTRDRYGAK